MFPYMSYYAVFCRVVPLHSDGNIVSHPCGFVKGESAFFDFARLRVVFLPSSEGRNVNGL